ncbi:hypothetical protein KAJ89_03710 [Candidatus Parcubacteria bacterium]|nr:hypothetical protein [Candidatus Parcubacteria bacterium]
MGRLSLEKRNIRRLVKVGGGKTYSITLPIEAIRKFNWQKRQKLVVDIDNRRKRLIIRDWKK